MLAVTTLLLGLALQEPRPQDPKPQDPRPPESKPAPAIPPELQMAIDAFQRAISYRFQVEARLPADGALAARGGALAGERPRDADREQERGGRSGDLDREPIDRAANRDAIAKALSRDGRDLQAQGVYESGKPVALTSELVEAYRGEDKIVFRTKTPGEWRVLSAASGAAPDREQPAREERPRDERPVGGERVDERVGDQREEPAGPESGDARRTVERLLRLPLPNDLLEHLERDVSAVRRTSGDAKSESATFECVLRPEAVRRHFDRTTGTAAAGAADARPAAADPLAMVKHCTLRITVSQGKIDRLVLESGLPLGERGDVGARPTTGTPEDLPTAQSRPASETPSLATSTDVLVRYSVSDIGTAEVKVPEDAARLLGTR